MAKVSGWLKVARGLAALAVAIGVLGVFTYSTIPAPESWPVIRPVPGLLLSGLMVIGGIALFAASRSVRRESSASMVNLAACSAMVVTLLAATSAEIVTRLWVESVIRFS